MTLTLELPPELQQRMLTEAERRGLNLDQMALEILRTVLPPPEHPSPSWQWMRPEDWLCSFNDWMDSHATDLPPLSDADVSRESLYEGRE